MRLLGLLSDGDLHPGTACRETDLLERDGLRLLR